MNNFMMMVSRNKPGIIMGIGIGSMIASVISAIKYSPMAKEALEEKKEELGVEDLDPLDKIKTAGPYFIPTIVFLGTGITCVLCGNQINLQRQAAAVTACAISETTSQIYREKVRDIIGERKEKTIHEAASKESYYRDLENKQIIIASSNSNDGFQVYDTLTKQKIRSKVETINRTINELNRRMLIDTNITLDEYCLAMNEDPMEFGTEIGWNIDRGYIELYTPTAIVSETGEPVIVIKHKVEPHALY